MRHTKITKSFDSARFGEALKRAGIDPRTHVSLGVIAHTYDLQQNQFVASDNDISKDQYGIYANVVLTPELTPIFCTIAPAYAGAFGGLYFPYHLLDTVIVVIPDGNMNNHPSIISHYYTGTEQVPSGIDLQNMWLILENGANINVTALGGNANIDINGTINVKSHNNVITLASDGGGVENVGRVNDTTLSNSTDDATFWAWVNSMQAIATALVAAIGKVIPMISEPVVPTSQTGHISSGSSIVKAGG
jgi:hypothetical protein